MKFLDRVQRMGGAVYKVRRMHLDWLRKREALREEMRNTTGIAGVRRRYRLHRRARCTGGCKRIHFGGPRATDRRIRFKPRHLSDTYWWWEPWVDGAPVEKDIVLAANELEDDEAWERYILYWSEGATMTGVCSCRFCDYSEAASVNSKIDSLLADDDRRKKNDPERLDPVERQKLMIEGARWSVKMMNLLEGSSAILEGREPEYVEVEEVVEMPAAQYQMIEVLKSAEVVTKTRATAPKEERQLVAAGAKQGSLF